MELFTLDLLLKKSYLIDDFQSAIWTERYYGDGDVELVFPKTAKSIEQLPLGAFIGLSGSKEAMILETYDADDEAGTVKLSGISVLKWMNNRFIRTSATHTDRTWYFDPQPIGEILWVMISDMCTVNSHYLNGDIDTGIPEPYLSRLIIHELGFHNFDSSGGNIPIAMPFGPLYDGMRALAEAYEIGMQILREPDDAEFPLGFRSYKGINRTSEQSANPVVRFSPFLDSLINVKELRSIANYKNVVFAYATEADDNLGSSGIAAIVESAPTGFALRALELAVGDIDINIPDNEVIDQLNVRAEEALLNNAVVQGIDGEIVSTHQFQYDRDYMLGDLVEIQGTSGVLKLARVTEYIRTQSAAGEKAYPAVTTLRNLISLPQ